MLAEDHMGLKAHDRRTLSQFSQDRHEASTVSEFVYFLAAEGYARDLLQEHLSQESGDCAGCGRPWPCNWMRLVDLALEVQPMVLPARPSPY
jgi:hypothetical protein